MIIGKCTHMYSLKDLKSGLAVTVDSEPYLILKAQFSKQGRQGGVTSTKMKNLKSGAVVQKTFQGNDKLAPAEVGYKHVQFLYKDESEATFMDLTNYDQFALPLDSLGDDAGYIVDGMEVDVLTYQEQPIGVKIPISVELKVVETTPGVKGDTAQGGSKPATLESGITINVPLFVNEGDTVKVNTERKEYVERVDG